MTEYNLQILKFPDAYLRLKCTKLSQVNAQIRGCISEMFDLLEEAEGVGLSANQVGIPYRFFITSVEGVKRTWINPVVLKRKGTVQSEEGCLSLPGEHATVPRTKLITVNAYSVEGEEIKEELRGDISRIFQHELDHLDGLMFTDRVRTYSKRKKNIR